MPAVLVDRSAHEAIAWVLIATTSDFPGHDTWRRASFAMLSDRAGWQQVGQGAAAQRWSRAIRGLVGAELLVRRYGWVAVEHRPVPLYRPRYRGRSIELPAEVLDAITGPDRDTPRLLWHWLAWRDAAHTERPSANGVAERLGVARATVFETVRELAGLGVLQLHHEPGHAYEITFGPVDTAPTSPAREQVAALEALMAAGVLVAADDAEARAAAWTRLWAWSQAHPLASVTEGAVAARLAPHTAEALLDEAGRVHPRHEHPAGAEHDDAAALATVRAHVEATGNLRSPAYRDAARGQGWVGLDALVWRWGSWSRVLAAAGVSVPEVEHVPGQPIPADRLQEWVRAYLAEAQAPTLADMTRWMTARGGPSRSTIRRRVGGWAQVMELLQPGDPAWDRRTSPEDAVRQRAQLREWSHERPGVPILEGARRVGVDVEVAIIMLGDRARLYPRHYGRGRERGYSDEDLLGAIREHVTATNDHRTASYKKAARQNGWPSADIAIKRFGTWRKALTLAGVPAPDTGGGTRGPAITDAQLRLWVASYLSDAPAPTWRDLDLWLREHGGPSASTVRTRCGTWAGVLALAEPTTTDPSATEADAGEQTAAGVAGDEQDRSPDPQR